MQQKLVLASTNPGKITEFSTLFADTMYQLVPQADLAIASVPETGLTFIENAIIKARHASQHSGLPALADDSGLVVDALNGAPGIYSARYAGPNADATARNQKLLTALRAVPEDKRQACFYCVLVLLQHPTDPSPLVAQGIWHGTLLSELHGSSGFGYDPLFFDPVHKKAAAQMSPEEKNQVSHRGQAMRELMALIGQQYKSS